MSYLIRRILAEPRLILDEMCRLYGKFASYLRRVLCKTRLIFPCINGPYVCLKYCSSSCYGNVYFFYNLGFDTDPTEKRHFGEYIPVI